MDFSLITPVFRTLCIDAPARLIVLEAGTLAGAHVPPFPPDWPALLVGVNSGELALHLKAVLLGAYPEEHPVIAVDRGIRAEQRLKDLDGRGVSETTCFYLPPLGEGTSFEAFAEIVAHLRAPDGCPWDREQTHHSLRTHLLEESYEALAAMDAGDSEAMLEEFGDLLLQIVLNAQIASEAREFSVTGVIKSIHDKIIRRHPHVFGDVKLEGVPGVLQNWEKLKERERDEKQAGPGLLDGVPAALPALTQAQEYQDRAARVGFDWPEIQGVLDKVREEIDEIEKAGSLDEVAAELGDLFFALVNLARWRKVDAEAALRRTNLRFKQRFAHVEQGAKKQGRSLSDLQLGEMDALWNEAKSKGL